MATTKRGIRYPYGEDYDLDADVPEDLKKMAESTDEAMDDVEESLEEKLGTYENTYDSTETYLIGSIVVYDKKIYECLEETTGEFDTTKWQEITIKELIDIYKQQTDNNTEAIQELDETKADIEDVEELQNEIEENYKEITKLQEENEDLKKNQLTNTPTPATSHYLQDSADSRFRKFSPIGRTTQESTTGVQLINITAKSQSSQYGIDITVNNDKSITLNGTSTSSSNLYFKVAENLTLSPGNYTLSNGNNNAKANSFLFLDDGNTIPKANVSNVTLTEDTVIKPYIRIAPGTTMNKETVYPMIVKGTYTAETMPDYEPYTGGEPAPNPRYPYAIKNTGDNVNELNVVNENVLLGVSDYNNYVVNDNTHSVDITGKALFGIKAKVNPNTDYTFRYVLENFNSGARNYRIREYSAEPNSWNENYIAQTVNSTFSSNIAQATFKTTAETTWITVVFYGEDGANGISIVDWKLEKGTIATPYSPYGCGNVNEKISNKNLFTEKNMTSQSWLNGSGVATYISTAVTTDYIKAPLSRECIFSNINTAPTGYFAVNQYDANKNRIAGAEYNTTTNFNQTFTLRENCVYIRISIYNYGKSSNNQLEVGTSKTDYIAHSEQNLSFPLAQGQKFYEGEELKENGKDDMWGEIVFDNTTNIYKEGEYNFYTDIIPDAKTNELCKCSHFNSKVRAVVQDYANCFISPTGRINMQDYKNFANYTAQEFKDFVVEQYANGTPIKLVYKKANPTITPYTEEQKTAWEEWKKARTYKNVTHISSEDETPANVEVEYVRDTETVINNLETRIEKLESEG